MGVTVYASGISLDFDMGYGGFFNLRRNIALILDKDFGELYSHLTDAWKMSDSEKEAYYNEIEKIINLKNLDKNYKYPEK